MRWDSGASWATNTWMRNAGERGRRRMGKRPLRFESPHDSDNVATFALNKFGLTVSVAEEQAVDSYNSTFECDFDLTAEQVAQLRDWLKLTPELTPEMIKAGAEVLAGYSTYFEDEEIWAEKVWNAMCAGRRN